MSDADDRVPAGRRVRLAGCLITAAAVLVPVAGAFQPAQASAQPSVSPVGAPQQIQVTTPGVGLTPDKDKATWAQRQLIGIAAVANAKKKIGSPYVWGATGPNTFDCSGLVQWAYKKAGVKIPRVTYAQYNKIDEKITWKNLAVGDLVFFNAKGHVGIVSKRQGAKLWMIHAPYTGSYVKQVKLDGYRRQTFAGAVRPF
ncbi:C40 family peptidase [Actinomadura sp. HBU206391]|uniref:C40 family peptidase n=1 Tax=Actinomadura sp. HBU206391 TaxID=2731692 RepID=UPI001C9C9607|nr:C40 family peptidase [Actinomadura sp. HBU206391]